MELHPDLARVLVDEETIQAKVKAIAARINDDYAAADRVYLVGVLKGAFIFLADLVRQLTVPHVVDFMALSSYGRKGAVSGAVRLVMDLREPIEGEHVIIVEDIVDSGETLSYLYETLLGRRPASLRTCTLAHKKRPDALAPIHYEGVVIPDVWVVGYGLDYAERHRTLPYIAELKEAVYS